MAITPSILKATEGLINGQGISFNSTLRDLLKTYQTGVVTGAIANLQPYTSNVSGIYEEVFLLPPYLLGNVNVSSNSAIKSNIANIVSRSNSILPNCIPYSNVFVTGTLTTGSVNKFISVMNQSLGFVGTSTELKKASAKLGSKSYSELGPGITKFSDVASGGMSTAFGNIENLKLVANAISKFGTAYDINNASKLHNYGTFIINLQNQGLGDVGDLESKLITAGVDLTDLENANQEQLKAILQTITGSELQKVISQTEVTLASTPKDLSEFLDSLVVFTKATRQVIPGKPETTYTDPGNGTKTVYPAVPAGSLESLGSTLSLVGGSFKTFAELGSFLNNVQSTSSPALDAAMATPADPNGLDSAVGLGHGSTGACVLSDMIGSLSGYIYNKEFAIINSIVTTTGATSLAQTVATNSANVISTVAEYGDSDPNVAIAVDSFNSAVASYNSSISSAYSKEIETANASMLAVWTQFQLEDKNLEKAGMNLSDPAPSGTAGILNFGKALHTNGLDKSNFGTYEFLSNIATTDGYGEAIKSALTEGKNLDAQSQAGVTTGTS